jgi:hypothetical protein
VNWGLDWCDSVLKTGWDGWAWHNDN